MKNSIEGTYVRSAPGVMDRSGEEEFSPAIDDEGSPVIGDSLLLMGVRRRQQQ